MLFRSRALSTQLWYANTVLKNHKFEQRSESGEFMEFTKEQANFDGGIGSITPDKSPNEVEPIIEAFEGRLKIRQ